MSRGTDYPFRFSFVMPVYNVEKYLDETVQSILSQTLDFEQYCEIVFVNDGSPDNVEEVCLKYKRQFPKNIKYIKQENQGVSAARNVGIAAAEGEYVSFLDSDDLISSDTLQHVSDFFYRHSDVDIVAIKMQFFEAATNEHTLNYKFYKTRVVDVKKEYDSVQLSASSTFVRLAAIKDKHSFDSRLSIAEDVTFINQVIIDTMKYGVVTQPTYYYRRRAAGGSAINSSRKDKRWYTNTPKYAYNQLFTYAKAIQGNIPAYIQYVVMYDLQGRFRQEEQDTLTQKQLAAYKASLIKLLQSIDDKMIIDQQYISPPEKLFVLEKKHGKADIDITRRMYEKYQPPAWVEFISYDKGLLVLEGHINYPIDHGYSLYFEVGGTTEQVKRTKRPGRYRAFLGETVYDGGGFKVSLPLEDHTVIKAYFKNASGQRLPVPVKVRRFTKLADMNGSYRVIGDSILTVRAGRIAIEPYTDARHLIKELRWLVRIAVNLKLRYAYELLKKQQGEASELTFIDKVRPFLIPAKAVLGNAASIAMRLAYRFSRLLYRKPIWIVSDRTTAAGDNGEALFRYLNDRNDVPATVYFAISKQSGDYSRMKQYGKVLPWGSLRYKLLFLLSDKIISSHADDFIINPFGARRPHFHDLLNFDYVFLQHGVTKDDISSWLNRYNKNIAIFVTAAKPEYLSILDAKYGYTSKQVQLTGLPRYDLLDNTPKGKVVIAPTWRKALADEANQRTGTRQYDPNFKRSAYYTFYQALLSDERIHKALKDKDMTLEFYLHPSHGNQVKDYIGSDRVIIKKMPYSYKTAFSEGDILVTDYSSVAFDFAYLKKPILYTQFDKEDFFGSHIYEEGYFSYERDGFGPVTYTYDDTVKELVDLIKSGATMSKKYTQRVESFFDKFDKRNSERVYKAVLALNRHKR